MPEFPRNGDVRSLCVEVVDLVEQGKRDPHRVTVILQSIIEWRAFTPEDSIELVADGGSESEEARKVLCEAGLDFAERSYELRRDVGRCIPRIVTRRGEFAGLQQIRWYAESFAASLAKKQG
jgi:hypothetical protein